MPSVVIVIPLALPLSKLFPVEFLQLLFSQSFFLIGLSELILSTEGFLISIISCLFSRVSEFLDLYLIRVTEVIRGAIFIIIVLLVSGFSRCFGCVRGLGTCCYSSHR
jgi:hypothetical protein